MRANKYNSQGALYAPGERAESQARYICYGYMDRFVERGQGLFVVPFRIGRNATKRFNRKVHGVRK